MKMIEVNGKTIGNDSPCYIIAEMSANHAGDFNKAIEIIHAAKEADADCIKIQTYTPETLTIDCDNEYFKVKGSAWDGYNLYQLYKKAYTPWEWQSRLKEEADKLKIDFLSTPFDKTSVDFLEGLNVNFYKIASFELIDIPLIKYVASKGKPIIMSTGMGSLSEICEAIKAVHVSGNNSICLLKCSSAYPAIPDDMNLRTIKHLEQTFNVPVGLSDHSLGSVGAIAAVAMGAKIIEKHFCLSRKIENPDSHFSMEPNEFKKMVSDIRSAERAIGSISYEVSAKEEESRIFRKSIFVVKDINEGQAFTQDNIRVIRPGNGLEPKYYEEVIGKKSRRKILRGTPLSWTMIE